MMQRAQSRCFWVSAVLHGLLLVLLFFSPAFHVVKPVEDNLPVIDLLPGMSLAEMLPGTGAENLSIPGGPPAQEAEPVVLPPVSTQDTRPPDRAPQPARPDPEPPKVVKEPAPKVVKEPPKAVAKSNPEPVKAEPKKGDLPSEKTVKNNPKAKETASKSSESADKPVKKPAIEISNKRTTLARNDAATSAQTRQARERAEAAERDRASREATDLANRNRSVSQALEKLGSRFGAGGGGSGDRLEVPGLQKGTWLGSYSKTVQEKYHAAWTPPGDLSDSSATVTVQVVIARDGRVKSSRVLKYSKVSALDRSVDRALRLERIAPFPDGAKEDEIPIVIYFNLKTKREFR